MRHTLFQIGATKMGSHDMQLIERLCHRIIVLAEGRILQEGSMEEIRNNAKVVDAYFGSANI